MLIVIAESDDSSTESNSSSEEDEEDSDHDDQVPLTEMGKFKYWVKKHWEHYRPILLNDYVRAAYLLCPRKSVREHARDHPDPEDRRACERLLKKLMIDQKEFLTHDERRRQEAEVVTTFLEN